MSIFETEFFINGQQVRPKNANDLKFVFDFTGDDLEAELSTDQLVLEGEAKQLVIDHIDNGNGVFEGIPFRVKVDSVVIDYFITLRENPLISGFGDSEINVSIIKRKGIRQLTKQIDGLSFEDVNRTHPFALVDVPYVIVKDNQLEMLIMLGISTYTMVKALVEGVQGLVDVISAGVVESSVPSVGATGPVTNTGAIIAFVLRILAYVVYLAAITLALIDLTKQIIELLFPPLRYLKACKVRELLTRSLERLGYQFQSSIIDEFDALTILPVPLKEDNDYFTTLFSLDNGSYTEGYPTDRDTTPLLGDLFRVLGEWFNGEKRLIGSTVYFERRDFWEDQASLSIINTMNLQDKRENQWTYNMAETWKRYYMKWRLDSTDMHTLDSIGKTSTEYTTEPVNIGDEALVDIDGVVSIQFDFAIGVRKNELSFLEEAAIPFAEAADETVQFFGGDSNYAASIQGKVGVTQVSQIYWTTTKMLYAINGRQPNNYLDIVGADAIYQKFHTINQVKENFQRIYNATIPFSTQNFLDILNNNYVYDQDGSLLKVLRLEWINEAKQADIEYSQKSYEGQNTKTVKIG